MGRTNKPLRLVSLLFALAGLAPALAGSANATPALVIDVASGGVLFQDQATQPWYPASLTKLMTVYVALSAVRDHRISLDTPLVVSPRAAQMVPSKMGFVPGTQVTLDNALKMMMVKSANDLAITIAEGISGSVEAFADEMNDAATQLGLQQSHFANPNGLPDPRHVSSARDLAVLARALFLTFPDHADLFDIGALSLGSEIIPNHNNLLGRYPGVDGMKTGFTCAAGFNLVASANRGGRRLIVVILGAPNVAERTMKAAVLFDRGFAGIDRPSGALTDLAFHGNPNPPDMHDPVCRQRKKAIAQFHADVDQLAAPLMAQSGGVQDNATMPERSFLFDTASLSRQAPIASRIAMVPAPVFQPQPVYVGAAPGYVGPVAQARPAHSPVGTEPPPATASAYTATKTTTIEETATPLAPDAAALPLKGRNRVAKKPAAKKPIAKVAVAAPDTADAKKPPAKPATATIKKPAAQTAKAEKPQKTKAAAKAHAPAAKAKPETPAGAD